MLPWIFAALFVICLLGVGGLWLWQQRRLKKQALPQDWELNPRPVFNSDERRVYRHLRDAWPQHVVLSKLPLVRFSQSADPRRVRYWYDLLGHISVAFAVCSPNGRVLLAIDLEGEGTGSRRSMQIKHAALAACKVRYLRCAADRLPSVPELQALVPAMPTALVSASALAAISRDAHANQRNAYASGAMGLDPLVPAHLAPAPLAPAVHQARESLSNTVASRRRQLGALWQDSGFMQESFYVTDSQAGPSSGFDRLASGRAALPDDVGGVVIDTPVSPLRH
jgi:Protein of unknown function (DUF2726)